MKTLHINTFRVLLFSVLLFSGLGSAVFAAPSDLDPNFGIQGKLISSPTGSPTPLGYALALQPDGKIVMSGGYFNSPGNVGFVVARYNSDGSLDTGFGSNGSVTVSFGFSREAGTTIALQPDGKIVVGGPLYNGGFTVGIIRLNTNGSLDTSFDGDGKVMVNAGTDTEIFAIQIASDGKIVFAGDISPAQLTFSTLLGKLNADGSRDTTFGTNGLLTGGSGRFEDLKLLTDGSMIVANTNSLQFGTFISVSKINSSGTVLWTESRGGNSVSASLNSVAVQPDGKIVAAGDYQGKLLVFRMTADGFVDTTFNISTAQPLGEIFSVAVQPDGKIVATFSVNGSGSFSVVRYNPDGSFDSGFGNGGIVITNVGTGSNFGRKLVIQPDGKVLVGGWASTGSQGPNYFAMVRYKGGAAAPAKTLFDYDGDGRADISVFRPSTGVWYILKSSDSSFDIRTFGISGDVPAPADFDGDGKTDLAIYRTGKWWYSLSGGINGNAQQFPWEVNGVPRPGDFSGDGRADLVAYQPWSGIWNRRNPVNFQLFYDVSFGVAEDKAILGDFDGDAKTDPAIYRPSTGEWWYLSSISGAQLATRWGIASDIPTPADFDGDGKTDFAVYRPSTGVWYIYNSSNGQAMIMAFGLSEDKPTAADYDGDGKADIAVFRPSTGIWYLMRSTAGFGATQFGISTDIPTPNAFVP